MSLRIKRFTNELMSSNCYIVFDEESNHSLCIDPASESSEKEIVFVNGNQLSLDYIILTHEHTDHTWGVNSLLDAFPTAKVICSMLCKNNLDKESQSYFRFYYDNLEYHYCVRRVDHTCEELNWKLSWCNNRLVFIPTPGHSMGSVCLQIDNILFSGDTVLLSNPYINKRNGSKELYSESIKLLFAMCSADTLIYPGHGDPFFFADFKSLIGFK